MRKLIDAGATQNSADPGDSRIVPELPRVPPFLGGAVGFGDDLDELIAPHKAPLAFSLGAMGSAQHNFYNDAYKRGGFADAATEVQQLWLDGKRDEAAARVPDAMVMQSSLIGTEEMVRERIAKYRDALVKLVELHIKATELLKKDPAAAAPHVKNFVAKGLVDVETIQAATERERTAAGR